MSTNVLGLKNEVCVVSGAGGGIGRSIARHLAEAGAKVAILDSNLQAAEVTAKEIKASGGTASAFLCDISKPESVDGAAMQIARSFGNCSVLVNNAALVRNGALSDLSLADWNAVISVNVTGFFLCSQIFGRQMTSRGGGSIVHVASIAGSMPQPNSGAYSVSKAGVLMLSRHIALEWGEAEIRSNVVSPAMVVTPMSQTIYDNADARAKRESVVPMRRIGMPDDIAAAVMYFAGSLSKYVSGQEIIVDGGWSSAMLSMVPRPGFDKAK